MQGPIIGIIDCEKKTIPNLTMDLAHSSRTSTGTTHTKKRILDTLGIASRHRAHSAAARAPPQAVAQQETSAHTHRTITTRVTESTAIT